MIRSPSLTLALLVCMYAGDRVLERWSLVGIASSHLAFHCSGQSLWYVSYSVGLLFLVRICIRYVEVVPNI